MLFVYFMGNEIYLRIFLRRKLGFERPQSSGTRTIKFHQWKNVVRPISNANDEISLEMNVVRLLFTIKSVRKSQYLWGKIVSLLWGEMLGRIFHKRGDPRLLEAFLEGKSQQDFIAAPEQELCRVYLHASLANEHRLHHVHSSRL